MELPLKGIKVIDYTGVQSGPACSQLMAWLGADVLKVERMHTGDNTRIQLRDIPNVDALYFTMVNSNTGMHLLIGILAALMQREKTGKGQRVFMSMQEAVLNLTRVKLRDQERLERVGYLEEYPQYPIREDGKYGTFTDAVPRGGNAGGGGQPGWVLKCKGWETDPNSYIYFTIQEQNWAQTCQALGKPEWVKDPAYATVRARQPHIFDIFAEIEKWLADKTKFEAVDILRKFEVPCAPVLSMKEIANDPALRASGSVVEVQQEKRGSYLTVGSPIKFSGFTPKITGAPLLGEHTAEVLTELGYSAEQIAKLRSKKVVGSLGPSPAHRDIARAS